MKTIYERGLEAHKQWNGKIETKLKAPITNNEELSLAYTPGVAAACLAIKENKNLAYDLTWKNNTIAVISDGSAVLGLGNIGPEAAMPVMEGKSALFKSFGNVDAIPICLNTQDTEEIINIVKNLAPSFGGINLEDISAPRCIEIEERLIEELNIPVFHDDQHGTAIVVTAGLINALKLVNKKAEDITVVVSGTGAAGTSIIKMLLDLGVKDIFGFNSKGIVLREDQDSYNKYLSELALLTNTNNERLTLSEAMKRADVFIGVSAPNVVTKEMVASMKENAIVFPMANPEPEISYDLAKEAGAKVVGTGRSDFPNQINNVLAFPGLFRGALDARATKITNEMKMAAAVGLASLVSNEELSETYVIPSAFDPRVAVTVAREVKRVIKK